MLGLLKMCGFEDIEAQSQLPRAKKAFEKLGIDAVDIETGKKRLITYYNVELEGVRKLFRLCMLELINAVLARDDGKERIIYGFMAPAIETIGSALVSRSGNVFSAHQCWAYLIVVGGIFNKLAPVLEAAESRWLKSGTVSHCSNVKSLVGLLTQDIMPMPDLLISAGYSCETAPKTVDMFHAFYSTPEFICDTCQDRELPEYTMATGRIIGLAAKNLRNLVHKIQEVVDFEITDDMLWEVIHARRKFNSAMETLHGLIETGDPLPVSATLEQLLMATGSLTLSLDGLQDAVDALQLLCKEVQERIDRGQGVVEKGAPRILAILPPHHSDPRLDHLAGEMGLAIVTTDTSFTVSCEITSDDPYVEMSFHLRGSLATSLPRRIALILEGCKRLNIDGVLNRYHVGCRAIAGDPFLIKEAVNSQLGIPDLMLEWENFDPRVYQHEQYLRRLQTFKLILNSR